MAQRKHTLFVIPDDEEQRMAHVRREIDRDPNVLSPMVDRMASLKLEIECIEELLESQKIPNDEGASSSVQGGGPANMDGDSKLHYMNRESSKVSREIADLLPKQKVLVNKVDEWQMSENVTEGDKRKLAELQSQIENMNSKGRELMNSLRRLDILYLQEEHDFTEKGHKLFLGNREARLKEARGEEASYSHVNVLDAFTSLRNREIITVLQSDSIDMKLNLETFKKANDVALVQIKKLQAQCDEAVDATGVADSAVSTELADSTDSADSADAVRDVSGCRLN